MKNYLISLVILSAAFLVGFGIGTAVSDTKDCRCAQFYAFDEEVIVVHHNN